LLAPLSKGAFASTTEINKGPRQDQHFNVLQLLNQYQKYKGQGNEVTKQSPQNTNILYLNYIDKESTRQAW